MVDNLAKPLTFSQVLARKILSWFSWKVEIHLPPTPKYVLVGAPHTSNWDFFLALLLKWSAGIPMHWVGKDSLFRWPVAGLLRKLGGIPVKRHSRNDFVKHIVNTFDQHKELVIAISPEGTRSKTDYWRTGFYYIALAAGVPIALGFADYPEKVVGIGPYFYPTGDIHADFALIQRFYSTKRGKHPHKQGSIRLRPDLPKADAS